MAIQRVFLDWKRPALHLVAEQLIQRSCNPRYVDLSHLILVFYGRQAGRRCEEILVDLAGGELIPPRIVTVGQLPELLYLPQRPFAPLLIQQLVWAQALKNMPPERLRGLMSLPPDSADQSAWLRLGELLRKQHEELARDQLDFSDVWKRGATLSGFNEVERWKLMAEIQQEYWRLLDSFELWDQQTARLEAIKRKEIQTDFEIVTIGTVDLNRTTRSMLDQISDQVTAYVPAPSSWADHFDAYGCLIPERWANETVDLESSQLIITDDPAGQCSAVLSILSGFEGRYAIDDITIGVPDPQLVIPLKRTLEEYGVRSHWPVDRLLSTTGPYRLLEAVAAYLEEPNAASFAVLIRHPDVSRWLSRQKLPGNWLSIWDCYFCDHLPRTLDDIVEGRWSDVVGQMKRLVLKQLLVFPRKSARMTEWGAPVRRLLNTVYGEKLKRRGGPEIKQLQDVCETLGQAFESHDGIPESLDVSMPAHEAIQFSLKNAECELYRAESDPAIQMVGWLEMPLDDAPVAIVTTFNETFVPKSVNHDLFLPNRLRTHLGIEDNARRYARDLYLLSTLVHSRDVLKLIVAKRNSSHDPLIPSRLLFATEPEVIAKRVIDFYGEEVPSPFTLPASPMKIGAAASFPIPLPKKRDQLPATFRVTEFRDYLASPYRYYLRHVLQLTNAGDDLDELDGAAFGTLVHDVLKRFGKSGVSDSRNVEEIMDFFHEQLKFVVESSYGKAPLAAVLIQSEQARRRLNAFANWQANWRRDGWEIREVEYARPEPVQFPLPDGRFIHLKGRIDRIDYHPESDRWAIFDYKTGDAGASPEKSHRYKGSWVDLQLPLYRHLAVDLCGDADIQLGYLVLPRDVNAVAAQMAEWTREDLLEADETAQMVAGKILDEEFWQLLPEPSGWMTEFDAICQEGVFGQEVSL